MTAPVQTPTLSQHLSHAQIMSFTIRDATVEDSDRLQTMIEEFANTLDSAHRLQSTAESIRAELFHPTHIVGHCVLVEMDNQRE